MVQCMEDGAVDRMRSIMWAYPYSMLPLMRGNLVLVGLIW